MFKVFRESKNFCDNLIKRIFLIYPELIYLEDWDGVFTKYAIAFETNKDGDHIALYELKKKRGLYIKLGTEEWIKKKLNKFLRKKNANLIFSPKFKIFQGVELINFGTAEETPQTDDFKQNMMLRAISIAQSIEEQSKEDISSIYEKSTIDFIDFSKITRDGLKKKLEDWDGLFAKYAIAFETNKDGDHIALYELKKKRGLYIKLGTEEWIKKKLNKFLRKKNANLIFSPKFKIFQGVELINFGTAEETPQTDDFKQNMMLRAISIAQSIEEQSKEDVSSIYEKSKIIII